MTIDKDKLKWSIIISKSWRIILGFLAPIILSPLLFDLNDKINTGSYVLGLMVIYWMFEPINLYVTALIPVALFPLLEIATTEEISQNYMKAANMMFFGGLIIGVALEYSNLHHRISLKVILWFGSSIPLLMAGVMVATMFLSMWINNTATTAMMIPIVDDILHELVTMNKDFEQQQQQHHNSIDNGDCTLNIIKINTSVNKRKFINLRKAFLLSIAYSANIGGTATLTGTGTNLVFQDVVYNHYKKDISFASWSFYAIPSAIVTVMCAWLLLYLLYVRDSNPPNKQTSVKIRKSAKDKYLKLGPMTLHEYGVLTLFLILVLLWFSRQPEIFTGWAELISTHSHDIKDATPALLITVLLFLFPANIKQFYTENNAHDRRLLCWNEVKQKMSWGVLLLLGGGFALAYGTEKSGLSNWFSQKLSIIHMNPVLTMIILSILAGTITEMASNVATANVILPVVSRMAIEMNVNPLLFMIPVTICISFAFMFPVSTPPNAIVFDCLKTNILDMVKPGILMNLIAITIQLISINTLGIWIFDLNKFPSWAINATTSAATT